MNKGEEFLKKEGIEDMVMAFDKDGEFILCSCLIEKALNEQLNLGVVSITLPSIESTDFNSYLEIEGYKNTLNEHIILKDGFEYDKDTVYKHYCNLLEFGN